MATMKEEWAKIEGDLRDLLDRLRGRIDEDDAIDVEDFIENREYEVALHWLLSSCEKNAIKIDEDCSQIVESINRRMGDAS